MRTKSGEWIRGGSRQNRAAQGKKLLPNSYPAKPAASLPEKKPGRVLWFPSLLQPLVSRGDDEGISIPTIRKCSVPATVSRLPFAINLGANLTNTRSGQTIEAPVGRFPSSIVGEEPIIGQYFADSH